MRSLRVQALAALALVGVGGALVVVATAVVATPVSAADRPRNLRSEIRTVIDGVLADYRWFHQNPELSRQEKRTAARLAERLRAIGLEVHEGIGETGLVGVLRARNDKGPVILYRADMDGLPVTEVTGLPYASTTAGVMHACGHDVHMATALGTLQVLKAIDNSWKGTVLFVAQPAEEIGWGARAMLEDRAFQRLIDQVGKPRLALALHDAADLPAGDVSLVEGFATANVDSVDVIVHGKGGHGSRPHEAIDPVLIASDIVVTLQSIVARRVRPGELAVITVGKIEGGTKHNIIASQATLLLTVRSYGDEMRKHLLKEIERVAVNVAQAHGVERDPEILIRDEFTPSGYNDPDWTSRLRNLFVAALGPIHVGTGEPSTGGEDFGRFAQALSIPGVMYRLGAANRSAWAKGAANLPGLHSDRYLPDPQPTLETGIETMTLAILAGLGAH